MYKIEYQQDNGLVTSITDATETPVTLQEEGVAYYKGEIPEDREGFTKELYWGVDPEVNVNTKARIANSETLYAVYTPIEGWLELATMEYVSGVEGKIVQLEQDVNLFNRKPQGLKFKAGDNSVFAKTMKSLALGTDDFTVCLVARTEGSSTLTYSVLGSSKKQYTLSSLKIYGTVNLDNTINWVLMQAPLSGGESNNSVNINKIDNTTNLHHIVITRSGTLVTCTINGRLVKSVTQDRVLDFSNFIYDIANTSYFWGGYVFNYAMTQAESNKLLWNGGRYDEVRLPNELRKMVTTTQNLSGYNSNKVQIANNHYRFEYTGSGSNGGCIANTAGMIVGDFIKISAVIKTSNTIIGFDNLAETNGTTKVFVDVVPNIDTRITVVLKKLKSNNGMYIFYTNPAVGKYLEIKDLKIESASCLLEYCPENIRDDRYLNSGTMGSEYDLVYSAVKPEVIYEKPYTDKVMLDENKAPDWHPIAMGQEVETPTNIFKAKLPDVGKEWQVSDWKQINN